MIEIGTHTITSAEVEILRLGSEGVMRSATIQSIIDLSNVSSQQSSIANWFPV